MARAISRACDTKLHRKGQSFYKYIKNESNSSFISRGDRRALGTGASNEIQPGHSRTVMSCPNYIDYGTGYIQT